MTITVSNMDYDFGRSQLRLSVSASIGGSRRYQCRERLHRRRSARRAHGAMDSRISNAEERRDDSSTHRSLDSPLASPGDAAINRY
jgi:hypothetical protein